MIKNTFISSFKKTSFIRKSPASVKLHSFQYNTIIKLLYHFYFAPKPYKMSLCYTCFNPKL